MHIGSSCRASDFLTAVCLTVSLAVTMPAVAQPGSGDHQIRSFELMSPEAATLTLDAPADQSYQFWVSTNLPNWVPAGPLAPVGFNDGTATYRVDIYPERPNAVFRAEYREIPPNPEPVTQLSAPDGEPVVQHLPDMGVPFEDETEEVSTVNNLPVSLAHLLVHFKSTTTVADLNGVLTAENLSLAGTVPLMHLGVLRSDVVTTMENLSSLSVRLLATDLFNEVAFNIGETLPRTFENPQPVLNRVGRQRDFLNWTWEWSPLGTGFGGNNAFEMSRIPQLWNWMDYAYRQRELAGGHEVAVLEFAFNPHQDLHPNVVPGSTSNPGLTQKQFYHGIAVTGVIAAKRNSVGTDGVTPLPDKVRGIPFLQNNTSTNSFASVRLGQLASILSSPNPPKVINISSGVLWKEIGDPTMTNHVSGITYAEWMDDLGALYASAFKSLNQNTGYTDYLIVCSAGNDDGVDAVYNSPSANVACRPELNARAPNFLTVENVMEDRTTSPTSNYDISGAGDSVSAGGTGVTVLYGPSNLSYSIRSGTSYAAPLVTGLASFLWSLEPSLTIQEMKSLLMHTNTTFEVQGGERGNLVDGFSAALAIDELRQSPDLHRALVDVDDGTLDGNLREEIIHFSEDPDQIHTPDGRRGDGVINMKDFRAFRDAWVHVIGETDHLDGPPTHFKRDLNFDGLVFDQPVSPAHPEPYDIRSTSGESLPEMIYSRYDFNGNGVLDPENQSASPPVESLAPFRADPDTEFDGRSASRGILRDVDVLLDKNLWEQNEENVVLNNAPPYPDELPFDWTTNNLTTLFVADLQSFDLHIDMDGGDPDGAGDNYDDHPIYPMDEGLEVQSYFSMTKGRTGEWEGIITVPYLDFSEIPTVWIHYRKSSGDEFHQYIVRFVGKQGEDVALTLGFDELQLYSNTREFVGHYIGDSGNPTSEEIIAKRPGAGIYGSVLVPHEEWSQKEVRDRARDLAVSALAGRLKFPAAFNGSPAFEGIYRTESEEAGVLVEVYGIRAIYDEIEGVPPAP